LLRPGWEKIATERKQFVPSANARITDKPIKVLIYSRIHKDHIGGAAAFKDIKDLKIVATEGVAEFLREQNDPNRPIPNVVFGAKKTITMGGKTVELTRHFYHSFEGDLFIYVPQAKFMMAVDCVTPGYAPFQGFDISENFGQYMKVFDELLPYDFDKFTGGHLTATGTKEDGTSITSTPLSSPAGATASPAESNRPS
jgi:glyoxylase-like metal-dependent hydrolase (beta-lactamase superfamily II)